MRAESVVLLASLAAGVLLASVCALSLRRIRRPGRRGRILAATLAVLTGVPALAALALTGWLAWFTHRPQPASERRDLFPGVSYVRDVRRSPRPVVAHVVTVDLSTPGVRFVATPAGPTGGRQLPARTTGRFLADFHAQLAINANYYRPFYSKGPLNFYPREGDGVDCVGVAAAGGVVYSPKPWRRGATFYVTRDGRPGFGDPPADVDAAVSGNGYVVRDGRPADFYPDDPGAAAGGLDARAAVGLDRDRRRLVLAVVDGKQPNYSEGVTMGEFAALLLEHGVDTAVRLDEGGSATLVAEGPDGRPQALNCPIHTRIPGRQRPVANHLGVVIPTVKP